MANLPLADGLDLLERRARFLQILLVIGALAVVPAALGTLAEMAGMVDVEAGVLDSLSVAYVIFVIAQLMLLVATIILFAMWIYRAAANVIAAGVSDFRYTAAWAVGWHFIPIANLWKPFTAMRQIWNASNGDTRSVDENHRLLTLWWIFWLISSIASNISLQFVMRGSDDSSMQADLVAQAADLFLYPLAYVVVKRITSGQVGGRMSGTIFT